MTYFANIDELLRMLGREKVLLKHMFVNRRELSVSYEVAMELVKYRQEPIRFLIEHGVIHDRGGNLQTFSITYHV